MVDLVITVKKVTGNCAAGLKPGDRIVYRGANVSLQESDALCGFAFANIYPAIFAARIGHDLNEFGFSERIVQCIDPGPPYGQGGTVLFEIKELEK
jgi:uncharacterized repeat protein (TIGR04076 family)